MIAKIGVAKERTLGFRVVGKLTKEDYLRDILPVLDRARGEGKKIRMLFHLGPEFEGFTPGAAWEDFKLGIRHSRTLERVAVVSDLDSMRSAAQFFGALIPCAVRVFKNEGLREAQAWLDSGAIGLDHHLDEENGLLSVAITGPLTSENFEILAHTVDSWLERSGMLNGIIIRVEKFPGWENLDAFLSHLSFIRSHHEKIRRVALVADGRFADIPVLLGKHFVKAEVKRFGYDQVDEARGWALQGRIGRLMTSGGREGAL